MVINFVCAQPTSKIVFHAIDLDINMNTMTLTSATDAVTSVNQAVMDYDDLRDFVSVYMTRDCLLNATYDLSFNYSGKINTVLNGFYRSSYKDQSGDTK